MQVAWLNYGGVVLGNAGSGNTIPAFQQVQSIKEGSTASTSPETTPAYKVCHIYSNAVMSSICTLSMIVRVHCNMSGVLSQQHV
jgi:hypothetical protein